MQISRLLIQCHWSIIEWYFSLILRRSTFLSIPHPSSNGWYSVLGTGVIAIPPSGPETVHSVKVFNFVLQINKHTDDSTLLEIQTTNHSIRATAITEMNEGGIATTHIMRVTRHKREESVKNYVHRLT